MNERSQASQLNILTLSMLQSLNDKKYFSVWADLALQMIKTKAATAGSFPAFEKINFPLPIHRLCNRQAQAYQAHHEIFYCYIAPVVKQ